MLISRTSIISGKVTERDLPVTQDQLDRWQGGELIQRVMPHLSANDREWLINGMTDEEQDRLFNNDGDFEL